MQTVKKGSGRGHRQGHVSVEWQTEVSVIASFQHRTDWTRAGRRGIAPLSTVTENIIFCFKKMLLFIYFIVGWIFLFSDLIKKMISFVSGIGKGRKRGGAGKEI